MKGAHFRSCDPRLDEPTGQFGASLEAFDLLDLLDLLDLVGRGAGPFAAVNMRPRDRFSQRRRTDVELRPGRGTQPTSMGKARAFAIPPCATQSKP